MDLDNQYFEEVLFDFYLKIFLSLSYNVKSKTKKPYNQSIINNKQNEKAKKIEKSKYVTVQVKKKKKKGLF